MANGSGVKSLYQLLAILVGIWFLMSELPMWERTERLFYVAAIAIVGMVVMFAWKRIR